MAVPHTSSAARFHQDFVLSTRSHRDLCHVTWSTLASRKPSCRLYLERAVQELHRQILGEHKQDEPTNARVISVINGPVNDTPSTYMYKPGAALQVQGYVTVQILRNKRDQAPNARRRSRR